LYKENSLPETSIIYVESKDRVVHAAILICAQESKERYAAQDSCRIDRREMHFNGIVKHALDDITYLNCS